jgi:hypothetical protein
MNQAPEKRIVELRAQLEVFDQEVEQKIQEFNLQLTALNHEKQTKIAEIQAIQNIKNARIQSVKEKKALGQKVLGFFGANKLNTARRLQEAQQTLINDISRQYGYKMQDIHNQANNIVSNNRINKDQIERLIKQLEQQIIENKQSKETASTIQKKKQEKTDLISRYTKLGYIYVPETTKEVNSCDGLSTQAREWSHCEPVEVQVPNTDFFEYITETRENPNDAGWKKERKTVIIPAKYEKRLVRGSQGSYGLQGHGIANSYIQDKVADEREEEITVWTRPLPTGYPKKVMYNDSQTAINKLESNHGNPQTRKRKHKNRKNKSRKN